MRTWDGISTPWLAGSLLNLRDAFWFRFLAFSQFFFNLPALISEARGEAWPKVWTALWEEI